MASSISSTCTSAKVRPRVPRGRNCFLCRGARTPLRLRRRCCTLGESLYFWRASFDPLESPLNVILIVSAPSTHWRNLWWAYRSLSKRLIYQKRRRKPSKRRSARLTANSFPQLRRTTEYSTSGGFTVSIHAYIHTYIYINIYTYLTGYFYFATIYGAIILFW